MKIRVKNFKGNEYLGYWNGSFYFSEVNDIPNLSRIYIEKECIHVTYETMNDMKENIGKYKRAYTYGYYEKVKDFFNKLLNWETAVVKKWNEINITSWNHLKTQYVAIIEKPDEQYGLIRVFISDIIDKTSSGANGTLMTQEPTEIGTLVETKDGSHKNMVQNIYRKTQNGWMHIAYRLNKEEWKIIDGKMSENLIEYVEPKKPKKNEEIINPLAKFKDEILAAELRKRGYDVSFVSTKKVRIPVGTDATGRFAKLELS